MYGYCYEFDETMTASFNFPIFYFLRTITFIHHVNFVLNVFADLCHPQIFEKQEKDNTMEFPIYGSPHLVYRLHQLLLLPTILLLIATNVTIFVVVEKCLLVILFRR